MHRAHPRLARAARASLETLERRALFAAGDLDPSFGFGGYTAADFGDGGAYSADLATSAQRIVVVGNLQPDDNSAGSLALAAFRHDGSIDGSFSGDGKLVVDVGATARAVVMQGDGKVVVSALFYNDDGRPTETLVLRFNANGSTDTGFGGGDGRVSLPVGAAISVAPGSKLVVGGQRLPTGETPTNVFSVARLNANGSLDASFGGDGFVDHRFDVGAEDHFWTSRTDLAVQPDGRVVLAGIVYGTGDDRYWNGGVARLNADGSDDTGFGGDGRVVLDYDYVDDFVTAVAVAPDQTILVGAVAGENDAFPVRLASDGTVLKQFTPGFEQTDNADIVDLHVDSEGRVVASGRADLSAPDGIAAYNTFLGRYRPDGTGLEAGFGGNAAGRFIHPPGPQSALAPDDGILVAAESSFDGALRVYRYLPEGGEDASGAATLAGGTLTVTGTSRGDEIRLEPGGAAGRVVVRVNGYERSFSNVSRVNISAGEGNDDVRVSQQITLPTTISGGAGEDRLEGGGGNDRLDGGANYDVFLGHGGNDEILSGPGGGSLNGGPGNDRLIGGDDADTFATDAGADYISGGGSAFDLVSYAFRTADLRIDLDGVADDGEVGEGDNILADVEQVYGGGGNDLIVGSAANNHLEGGPRGHDTLRGLGGDDFLQGYSTFVTHYGNDLIEGGDGEDNLRSGGPGSPDGFRTTLLGGNGNDTIYAEPDDTFDGGAGTDSVNGGREDGVPTSPASPIYLDEDTDTLYVSSRHAGADSVTLSRETGSLARFPETLVVFFREPVGTPRRVDVPYGDVRKIVVNTGSGDDRVDMGLVTIPADIDLGEGNDTVTAGMGNDTINGGAGNDSINGNAGDDVITDTGGTNVINGGLGTDTVNGVRETPISDSTYQAEDARVFGARVRASHSGFTGSGYVDFEHARGDFIGWNVTAQSGGVHALTFRYANGASDRPLQLTVNGQVVRSRLSFPGTTSWSRWQTVTVELPLNAGNNQVVLSAVGSGGPNVDSLAVRSLTQPPTADTWVLQGEDAASTPDDATVRTTHAGYTGPGYLDFNRDNGANATWTFDDLPGGEYEIEFRYANGSASTRTLQFNAGIPNSTRPVAFQTTGSWSTWRTLAVRQTLTEGDVLAVTLTTTGFDGPNIDLVTLRRVSPPQSLELQAEQAALVGARVKSSHAGFTGTGYADYDNATGDSTEWSFDHAGGAGRTLTFRYANGAATERPLELRVNGQVVNSRLSFAPTGSWSTWREVSVSVDLAAGANRVRLASIGNNGPNVDVLTIR